MKCVKDDVVDDDDDYAEDNDSHDDDYNAGDDEDIGYSEEDDHIMILNRERVRRFYQTSYFVELYQ